MVCDTFNSPSSAGNAILDICFYANPPTGSHTIYGCIPSQGGTQVIEAAIFSGVNQTTPFVGSATCTSGVNSSPSVTKTGTTSGNWVIDGVSTFDGSFNNTTRTAGSGQTKYWGTLVDGGIGYNMGGMGSYKNAGGSVAMSWTMNHSLDWADCAYEVKKN